MTKTNCSKPYLSSPDKFGISKLKYWNLFVICHLKFGISSIDAL
jgi:hypothetical protein